MTNMSIITMKVQRVCVIGAGAGGLAAIRHVKDDPLLEGQLFEQTNSVGGVWNYTDKTGNDEFGLPIHSTMYKTLRTNIPKEIMGYLDFPFPDSNRSYISHNEVLSYLQKYSDFHGLEKLIRFTSRVVSVEPEFVEGPVSRCPVWKVTVEDVKSKAISEQSFDAVMICNGHYTKPYYPDIANLEIFQGEILHSRDYRVPEAFVGKRVVVFGGGPSAIDISIELIGHASQVTMSSRNSSAVMPQEIATKSDVVAANAYSLITATGEEIDCDVLLICSGYTYEFPFLSPRCGISVEKGKYIFPLYRHLVNAKFPTMVFIGIPFTVCPFPLFDCQIRYSIAMFTGKVHALPSESDMINEIQLEEKARLLQNIPLNHSHKFGDKQWDYCKDLARDAGILPLIQPVVQKIYARSGIRRANYPEKFKYDKVNRIDSERYEYVEDAYAV